jgi:hypothetical protein
MTEQEKNKHLANVLKAVKNAVGTWDELIEIRQSFNAIQNELFKKDEKVIDDTNSAVK